jgi:hypothetical protein
MDSGNAEQSVRLTKSLSFHCSSDAQGIESNIREAGDIKSWGFSMATACMA